MLFCRRSSTARVLIGAAGRGATRPSSPSTRLMQRAQVARFQRQAAVEHVEHHLGAAAFQRDQEMAGKIDAVRRPAGGPRGMQPQDAERHRQAPAALDDADQVGVRRGRRRCPCRRDSRGGSAIRSVERPGAGAEVVRRRRRPRAATASRASSDRCAARRLPVGVRRIDARQLQRRVGDVDLGVRQLPDRLQRRARHGTQSRSRRRRHLRSSRGQAAGRVRAT